ncbi:hypothetical protein CsSME_00001772 [Camellia sinensis var. sinensis]
MAAEVAKEEERLTKLKIVSKTHVKPNKTLGRRECQLVTFDLPYIGFYYNQKLLMYKGCGSDFEDMVGSSPRFKVYEMDFGWGKPESVRSGFNNRFDGMVYLYQGKSGGKSIDVEISLEANAMEYLEKDKEFLMFQA